MAASASVKLVSGKVAYSNEPSFCATALAVSVCVKFVSGGFNFEAL